jgi:hypothetical protein
MSLHNPALPLSPSRQALKPVLNQLKTRKKAVLPLSGGYFPPALAPLVENFQKYFTSFNLLACLLQKNNLF